MKHKYMILRLVSVALMALCVAACNDDTEKATEWNATYVYLQKDNDLKIPVYNLIHSGTSITGDAVSCSFRVCLQHKQDKEVTVLLEASSKTIPAEKILLSAKEVTFKAGETESGEITVSVPDWSFAFENKEDAAYDLSVTITDVKTAAFNTLLSQLRKSFALTIKKPAYTNLKQAKPEKGTKIADRSVWKLAMGRDDKGDIYNSISSIIDDDQATYVLTNESKGFWITVDLGAVKDLSGINVMSYWTIDQFAPRRIEVLTSADGQVWASQGLLNVSGGNQDVSFIAPVKTQYLKYVILETSSDQLAIAEFNVYEVTAD